MKYSIFTSLLLSILFLSSCDNESSNFDDKVFDSELREGDLMSKKDCFEFDYPLGIVFPDNKVKNVKDEEEFHDALKAWYKTNLKEKEKPSLKYPVNVIFKGDLLKNIENEKDMISLKKFCDDKDEGNDKDCFAIVYPVIYEMPDGEQISGDNEDELNAALKSWYEIHPDSKVKPSLVYPVDVLLKDGSTVTINDEEAMIALKKEC